MIRDEFDEKYKYFTDVGYWRERNNLCIEYINSLEQQNTALQARINQLEEVNENYRDTIVELRNKVK